MKSLQSILKNQSLSAVLEEAEADVKADPIDADKRAYWAQLLLLYGDWSRAQAQLKAWEALAPNSRPTTQQLLDTVNAEVQRECVFRGETSPEFLTQPEVWLSTLVNALQVSIDNPDKLRSLAYEQANESAGNLSIEGDNSPSDNFMWLADADNRLGPVCEILIDDKYCWVPFQDIESITFQPPMNIVHLIWRHSLVKFRSGQQQVCQIPARYPLTEATNDSHRLGHRTDWSPLNEEGHYAGQGQKSWLTEANEYPLLTLHQVQFLADKQ